MPTAIIFLAVGRNGLARQCAARRGHLCRLPTEAAFPVILPVPFAAAAPHSPEGGQSLTNQGDYSMSTILAVGVVALIFGLLVRALPN